DRLHAHGGEAVNMRLFAERQDLPLGRIRLEQGVIEQGGELGVDRTDSRTTADAGHSVLLEEGKAFLVGPLLEARQLTTALTRRLRSASSIVRRFAELTSHLVGDLTDPDFGKRVRLAHFVFSCATRAESREWPLWRLVRDRFDGACGAGREDERFSPENAPGR